MTEVGTKVRLGLGMPASKLDFKTEMKIRKVDNR
jgi:hypothetical protein